MSNLITIEIFWNNLTQAKQQEFKDKLNISGPEDWNWEYIPIAIFETESDPDED
jgi:hypothetical protein